ncbi:hypothetical protein CBR_g49213, partial [Chara braunii]
MGTQRQRKEKETQHDSMKPASYLLTIFKKIVVFCLTQELAEQRKKSKRVNYDLEKEAVLVWEKIRRKGVKEEERS